MGHVYLSEEQRQFYEDASERRPFNNKGRPSELTNAQWFSAALSDFKSRESWQHQRDYNIWLDFWNHKVETANDCRQLISRPGDGFSYERCPNLDKRCGTCQKVGYHDQCIVVSVDGACRNNGYDNAIAAYGIFVGHRSIHNDEGLVFNGTWETPTSQKAELQAAIFALTWVLEMFENNPSWDIERVVIKADSQYVVKGMTTWIWKWLRNGFRNVKGEPVVNGEMFDQLDDLIVGLNNAGVGVQFWHVPREWNNAADAHANWALDMETKGHVTSVPAELLEELGLST
ncbi:MAG: hypothetical protein M1820_007045 [Bogoriella megaspora]|nr:MAG: hypothetical protein M1820_007045 [Bogoriella megaspora]